MAQTKKNIRITTSRNNTSDDDIFVDGAFNHCSTICPLGGESLIAFYSGTKECAPDQHVTLKYKSQTLRLPNNTGNPVLVEVDYNSAVLIYSVFTKFDVHPVHKWRHCELRKTRIRLAKNGALSMETPRKLISEIGFLGRCPALQMGGKRYLPLYHEYPGYGLILFSTDGWNWDIHSRIEDANYDLIQPTLWQPKPSGIKALLRNLSGQPPYAFYSEYRKEGWTPPRPTSFHNLSNSILVIPGSPPRVIWNSSPESRHFLLMKSLEKPMLEQPIVLSQSYGSYPSYAKIGTSLHVTFTTKIKNQYVICRKIF